VKVSNECEAEICRKQVPLFHSSFEHTICMQDPRELVTAQHIGDGLKLPVRLILGSGIILHAVPLCM
jgi:hypothetical protein